MPNTLELLIRSGNPLISIETTDEARAVERVRTVAENMPRSLWEWSLTTGLCPVTKEGRQKSVIDAGKVLPVLDHIELYAKSGLFLFKDLGPHTKDVLVHRKLRDFLAEAGEHKSTLILVDAFPLPDEIQRFTVRYELGWPDAEELEETVRSAFRRIRDESLYKVTAQLSKRDVEQLVQTLRGLSRSEAERVIASAVYDDYLLSADDLPRIVEAKRTLLSSAGCLEAIAADFSSEEIGGLDNLKKWLKQRRGGFTKEAREFGLDPPRGVLMLGVPGCGKSLSPKSWRRTGTWRCSDSIRACSIKNSSAKAKANSGRPWPRQKRWLRSSYGLMRSKKPSPPQVPHRRTAGFPSGCSARCSLGCRTTGIRFSSSRQPMTSPPCRRNSCEKAASMKCFSWICLAQMPGGKFSRFTFAAGTATQRNSISEC